MQLVHPDGVVQELEVAEGVGVPLLLELTHNVCERRQRCQLRAQFLENAHEAHDDVRLNSDKAGVDRGQRQVKGVQGFLQAALEDLEKRRLLVLLSEISQRREFPAALGNRGDQGSVGIPRDPLELVLGERVAIRVEKARLETGEHKEGFPKQLGGGNGHLPGPPLLGDG